MKKTIYLLFALTVIVASNAFAQQQSIEAKLKSHYIGKPVVAKIPLPDDKQPMLLYVDRDELLDKALYKLKLERVGVGIDIGMVAIITEIEAGRDEVNVRLVGVGYELPSGEVRKALLDDDVLGQGGARIRIKVGRELAGERDIIATVNGWLSNIVNTRALVSADDQPEPVRQAIAAGEILTGMSQKAVYLAIGEPTEIIREMKDDEIHEAWIYELEDFTSRVVFFIDGRVSKIKEY